MQPVIYILNSEQKQQQYLELFLFLKKEYYSKRISGSTSVTVELLGKRLKCKLL